MMTFLDGKNTGTAEYYEFQCVLLNVTPGSKWIPYIYIHRISFHPLKMDWFIKIMKKISTKTNLYTLLSTVLNKMMNKFKIKG